ncbi:hypothetical protein K0M31_004424, partial [Melipona bicolor]
MPITTARFSPGEARAPGYEQSEPAGRNARTKARSRFQFGRVRATNYGRCCALSHPPWNTTDQTVVTFQKTASEGDPIRSITSSRFRNGRSFVGATGDEVAARGILM